MGIWSFDHYVAARLKRKYSKRLSGLTQRVQNIWTFGVAAGGDSGQMTW